MSDGPALGVAEPTEPSGLEFVVAGNSHVFAMGAQRAYTGPVSLSPVEVNGCRGFFVEEEWQPGGRTLEYWDVLVEHAKGRAAVLVFGGGQHFVRFLLARTPLFDIVDPGDPGHPLYPGAVVVPRRMVMASLVNPTPWLRGFIPRLRAAGCRCVIVAGTPPVRADLSAAIVSIRQNPDWIQKAENLGMDLATLSITPAPIMKRLWGVVQETLADVARETGACFVPVPPAAFDADGYLAEQFRPPVGNFAHGNNEYGRLMLEHIVIAVQAATRPTGPF